MDPKIPPSRADLWLKRLKDNPAVATLIVVATVTAAVVGFWNQVGPSVKSLYQNEAKPTVTPTPGLSKLPGDTGWIFVGYYSENTGAFIEGPYVELTNKNLKIRHHFIEVGDNIRTKRPTKVYIVDFQETGSAKKLVSPTTKGVISANEETGVLLPARTELIVRDVSRGAWPGNPNTAIWVRVILTTADNGP